MTDLNERAIQAEERKAAALESIASQLPALIAALNKPRGGWNKKDGKDHGLFKLPPDLSAIPDYDLFHLPTTAYLFDKKYKRLQFFSPFNTKGEIDPAGARVASIGVDGKAYSDIFKEWKYDESGTKKVFALRILKMRASTYNDKKIATIVGIGEPANGVTDPTQLTYVTAEAT